MKKISVVVAVLGVTLLAPTALAGSRADDYYTVFCDGVPYESVDWHAVELGGKAEALARFPRADCELIRQP